MSNVSNACNCFDFVSLSVDAIVLVDEQGNISLFNRAAEKMYGWSREEVIGKKISVLLPSNKAERHDRLVQEAFQGKHADLFGQTVDVVGGRKSGRIFPVELTLSKIDIAGDHYVMAIVRDVSEKKKYLKELKTKRKKLQKMNIVLQQKVEEKEKELNKAYEEKLINEKLALLGTALSEISHDIRGPLGVISNSIYLLQAVKAVNPEYDEYLEMMKKEVSKALNMLEGMRYFLKNQKPTLRQVCLDDVVDEVLAHLPQEQREMISTDFSLANIVWAERSHLERVFLNLISNALDATSKEVLPLIKIYSQTEEENFIKVFCVDNGKGIKVEDLPNMFVPLFTTKSKGLGIGLVSCRNIVENCGGEISVESVYGQGATFIIKLLAGRGEKNG